MQKEERKKTVWKRKKERNKIHDRFASKNFYNCFIYLLFIYFSVERQISWRQKGRQREREVFHPLANFLSGLSDEK